MVTTGGPGQLLWKRERTPREGNISVTLRDDFKGKSAALRSYNKVRRRMETCVIAQHGFLGLSAEGHSETVLQPPVIVPQWPFYLLWINMLLTGIRQSFN